MEERSVVNLLAILLAFAGKLRYLPRILRYPKSVPLDKVILLFNRGDKSRSRLLKQPFHTRVLALHVLYLDLVCMLNSVVQIQIHKNIQRNGNYRHRDIYYGYPVCKYLQYAAYYRNKYKQIQRDIYQFAELFFILSEYRILDDGTQDRDDISYQKSLPSVINIHLIEVVIQIRECGYNRHQHPQHGSQGDEVQTLRKLDCLALIPHQIREIQIEPENTPRCKKENQKVENPDHDKSGLTRISRKDV